MSILGAGNSSSSLRNMPITQGDNGNAASGRNSTITEAGGITFSGNSHNQLGGIDFTKLKVGNNGALSLNIGASDDTLLAMSGSYLDTINNLQSQNQNNLSAVTTAGTAQQKTLVDSIKSTLADALANIAALAENKQTDGISGMSKTFLWLALGSLALIAFVWTKKK